ncbi:hypothetical protein VTO73DRAFT_3351 [Trametes versicolor]
MRRRPRSPLSARPPELTNTRRPPNLPPPISNNKANLSANPALHPSVSAHAEISHQARPRPACGDLYCAPGSGPVPRSPAPRSPPIRTHQLPSLAFRHPYNSRR